MFHALLNWLSQFIGSLTRVVLLLAVLTSGCGRDEIKVYNVPKEKPPQMAEANLPDGHPDLAALAPPPQLKWQTPDGWKEVPPGEMRVASFKVSGRDGTQADVSVIPLPGAAGGDLSNVNRWRGQVGQAPVSAEELRKLAQVVELAGQSATLFEQNGDNAEGVPTRILAVIQRRDDMAWFFKMTGDNNLVAQQKPVFVEFLKSFHFATGETATAQPATPPPSAGRPQWVAPSGWKEVPGGQFLVAKFAIAGEGNAQAAVNVSSSAGDGGGLAANVNRWRKQLGLGEISNDEIARAARSIETTSGKATLVEMSGKDARSGQPAALVGAMVSQPGQAWFYKLMGDAKVVAAQKDEFARFVQEVKY